MTTYAPSTTGTATTRPTRALRCVATVAGTCERYTVRAVEVAGRDMVAQGQVAGGDDRVDPGAEPGGSPVQSSEVATHDDRGHHRDGERGAPERERARGTSGHGGSFRGAAVDGRSRMRGRTGSRGGVGSGAGRD